MALQLQTEMTQSVGTSTPFGDPAVGTPVPIGDPAAGTPTPFGDPAAGTSVPIGDLHTIVELHTMQRRDASLPDVIGVIEHEAGLSVRLLKYMNSSSFGFSGRVRSIPQAAAILGPRGLSRWALIVASLSGPTAITRELALTMLTRARACELISLDQGERLDADELFGIGMFSTCDAVFRMPLAQVIRELALSHDASAALMHHSGPAGEILESVICCERSELLALAPLTCSAAYHEARDWAGRAIQGLV
jgi:EAL and modified HD-GYP domain-containing signal transduction protein